MRKWLFLTVRIVSNPLYMYITYKVQYKNFHSFDQISIFPPPLWFASAYYPHIAGRHCHEYGNPGIIPPGIETDYSPDFK